MKKFAAEYEEERRMLTANEHVISIAAVGSAVYSEDAKDLDVLVLVRDQKAFIDGQYDFVPCGEYEEGTWAALRAELGPVNLLVTQNQSWFGDCLKASRVCEALQLATKHERIVVYRIVRDLHDAPAALAAAEKYRVPA